jgi:hypothetical protein
MDVSVGLAKRKKLAERLKQHSGGRAGRERAERGKSRHRELYKNGGVGQYKVRSRWP